MSCLSASVSRFEAMLLLCWNQARVVWSLRLEEQLFAILENFIFQKGFGVVELLLLEKQLLISWGDVFQFCEFVSDITDCAVFLELDLKILPEVALHGKLYVVLIDIDKRVDGYEDGFIVQFL